MRNKQGRIHGHQLRMCGQGRKCFLNKKICQWAYLIIWSSDFEYFSSSSLYSSFSSILFFFNFLSNQCTKLFLSWSSKKKFAVTEDKSLMKSDWWRLFSSRRQTPLILFFMISLNVLILISLSLVLNMSFFKEDAILDISWLHLIITLTISLTNILSLSILHTVVSSFAAASPGIWERNA